jgi:1-pyrroline-5-carboxylate dehydrogenase
MVTGDGQAVSQVALADPRLAGIHFTGSTATFQHLWSSVGARIAGYRSYPRLVGETGGKDFVVAHPSADPASLVTGLIRGAFEFQGQKCSAASRAYLPRSLWEGGVRDALAQTAESLTYGDTTDFANFGGAVIDRRSFDRLVQVIAAARSAPSISVLAGGATDDSEGYFVRPTVLVGTDPTHEIFTKEYFGPILGVFVYEDGDWSEMLTQAADVATYALTGGVFATDRSAIEHASKVLRFSAGNFYVNDKPTGAVVGQQPFGGARASGTNDKAGSVLNLLRWVSPRSLKETFAPPTEHRYPHMA